MLGLRDPNTYLKTDGKSRQRQLDYSAQVAATLARAGMTQATQRAEQVLDLERKLAAVQWNPEKLRDRALNYHLMTPAELKTYAPGFPWEQYLQALGVGHVRELVLNSDTSVQASAKIFAETRVETWKSFLLFHWIQAHADLLPVSFREPGGGQPRPREREAIQFLNRVVPDVVGRLYIERHFSPQAKAQMEEMSKYLRQAFSTRIGSASWLDEPTRNEALTKISGLQIQVGYPDQLNEYKGATISSSDILGSFISLGNAAWVEQRSHLKKPTSEWRTWHMPPHRVDASYGPQLNRIVFPAGMLQPPFFDPCASSSENFGAIGAIMAHEMGHALDDNGAKFDASGRLRNWWSAGAQKQFSSRMSGVVEQGNSYEVSPGVRLNGALTVGENTADLTGLSVAFDAHRQFLSDNVRPRLGASELRQADRHFFLAWARAFRALEPKDWLAGDARRIPWAPPSYRVNGVVRNLDAWYDAFDVSPANKLYLSKERRKRVW
jgi:endothelin-converting enzyme/putative endopeptidase